MKEIILCKYGEIALKGLNKSSFEGMMTKSVKYRLKKLGEFNIFRSQSDTAYSRQSFSNGESSSAENIGPLPVRSHSSET